MTNLPNWLAWPRKAKWTSVTACGTLTPPAGLCDSCRELLAKRPATVLRAESYRGAATETGGRS